MKNAFVLINILFLILFACQPSEPSDPLYKKVRSTESVAYYYTFYHPNNLDLWSEWSSDDIYKIAFMKAEGGKAITKIVMRIYMSKANYKDKYGNPLCADDEILYMGGIEFDAAEVRKFKSKELYYKESSRTLALFSMKAREKGFEIVKMTSDERECLGYK